LTDIVTDEPDVCVCVCVCVGKLITAVNKAWERERLVEGVSLLNSRFFLAMLGFMREALDELERSVT